MTPQLLAALRDVASLQVDHLSPYCGNPAYVWHDGGSVPQAKQDALSEAFVLRLTVEIPAALDGKPGCAVRLSPRGMEALASESSPAVGPTVQSGVGVQLPAGEPNSKEAQ